MDVELLTNFGAGGAFLIIVLRELMTYLRERKKNGRNGSGLDFTPILNRLDAANEKLDTIVAIVKETRDSADANQRRALNTEADTKRALEDLKASFERASEDTRRSLSDIEDRIRRPKTGPTP